MDHIHRRRFPHPIRCLLDRESRHSHPKQQADEISSGPYGGSHPKHSAALLDQSKAARMGLVCVAVGAGFQIVSKLIEEFFS